MGGLFAATKLQDVEGQGARLEAALRACTRPTAIFMKQIDESGAPNDEIVETMRSAIARFKETRTW